MLDFIVGLVYGDEGKGRVDADLAMHSNYAINVRSGGGTQAGHTPDKGVYTTQVPCGFFNPDIRLLIARGTLVNPQVILEEVERLSRFNVAARLGIDPACTIIEPHHIEAEQELKKTIGSVGKGVGYARADRVLRKAKLARDEPSLKPFLANVTEELKQSMRKGGHALIETAHGYGIGEYNIVQYPYVTSQDTSVAHFLSDLAALGPQFLRKIYGVLKPYVSRVGKGPALKNELTDEEAEKLGLVEHGTVSGRRRRIALIDYDFLAEAVLANTPTDLVVPCVDMLFPGNKGVTDFSKLTPEAQQSLREIAAVPRKAYASFENNGHRFNYNGLTHAYTGPGLESRIDLRDNPL